MGSLKAPEWTVADGELPARPDVFVSYAREDIEFVRALIAALAERGKNAWVDWDDIPPTAEWLAEVYAGIETADTFVAVLTPDSLASEVCALELAHAVEHNKRIAPLLHRNTGAVGIPPQLEAPNWIFIRAGDDFDSAVDTLVKALETDLDWVRAHTRLLTRAIEWRSKSEDRSFMLSGSDLRDAERWLAQHDGEKEPMPTALQSQYVLASRRAAARRQRILLTAVVIGLAVASVLAVVAVLQRNEAVAQAKTSRSRALAASAVAQLPADPELSVLLAGEAARVAPTTEAEAALRLALPQSLVVAAASSHEGPVNTVEFSGDGRYVLSAGDDGVAIVWDWRAGKRVGRLRAAPSPGDELGPPTTEERLVASFSPDSSTVLAAAPGKALLWRWRTKATEPLRAEVPYQLAVFAGPDRLAVPVEGEDRALVIGLDEQAGDSVRLGDIDMLDLSYTAFDLERSLLMLADLGGDVSIWDWETTERLTRLSSLAGVEEEIAYDVALSGDGRHLAVGSSDGITRVWDWRARRKVGELAGHSSTVSTVAFSLGGNLLLTGSWDGTARVWNWRQRQEVAVLRGHRGWVTSAAFDRDESHVVTGGADGSVRVWAIGRQRSLASIPASDFGLISVDADADAPWILTAAVDYTTEAAERVVRVWNRRRSGVVAELRWLPVTVGDYAPGIEAAFSSRGSRVVAVDGQSGSIWVWDWRRTARLSPPLATPGKDLAPLATVPSWATDAAFSADGSLVATSFGDAFVRVWTLKGKKLVAELASEGAQEGELLSRPLESVVFSPDGRYVAAAGRGRAWVWDWKSKRLAAELEPGGDVGTAVFSPDGRLIATAGSNGVVRIYDWRGQRVIADLGHGERVSEIEFSPDGNLILTGSLDGTARVWDWEAERSVLELPDHPSWVTGAAFTAGGKMIVTGGEDGTARIFACAVCGSLADLQALVPERVTRGLTAEERARYLP